jgi:type IV pilus assembly protein PilQ
MSQRQERAWGGVGARERAIVAGWPVAVWAAVGGLLGAPMAQAQPVGGGQPPASPAAGSADGKPKVTVSANDTVDLHVKDESISNVLELLGVGSQRNIIVSKNVTGKVSADLYNVTFEEALNAILRANGLDYVTEGNFIYVYTREELAEMKKNLVKREAKVVTMSYLNAADASEFVKPLLSQGGEIKFVGKTPDFNIPSEGPTGADTYVLGATLVIIDYPENIAAIEAVLKELDTKPKQVLVQATVLQTALTEDNAFGVDLSIIADLKFTDFLNIGGPLGVADGLVRGGDGSKSEGNGLSPTDNQGVAIGSTPGLTRGRSTLKIGVVGGNVSAFVRLLDEVSDTVVMASPRLLTLNRQAAKVVIADRLPYLSTTQTDTAQTQTVQFLDTGIKLFVRPFIGPDSKIRMELKPQVSTGTIGTIKAAGGEVSVPFESAQELVTNVVVNDGMTVVLGGLFQETTVAARRQVPVIGDIPIIGAAFRGHDDSVDRKETIFLITPTIMNDSQLLVQGLEAGETTDRVRAGTRQGLLPWSRDRMTSILNVEAERAARDGESDKALWKIQRSLSLNPRQPEALRLRERLTGEKEQWPQRSLLDEMMSKEIKERMDAIQPPAEPPAHKRPWGSHDLRREPLSPAPAAPAAPHGQADEPANAPSVSVAVPATPRAEKSELAAALAPRELTVGPAGSAADQPVPQNEAVNQVEVVSQAQASNQVQQAPAIAANEPTNAPLAVAPVPSPWTTGQALKPASPAAVAPIVAQAPAWTGFILIPGWSAWSSVPSLVALPASGTPVASVPTE